MLFRENRETLIYGNNPCKPGLNLIVRNRGDFYLIYGQLKTFNSNKLRLYTFYSFQIDSLRAFSLKGEGKQKSQKGDFKYTDTSVLIVFSTDTVSENEKN